MVQPSTNPNTPDDAVEAEVLADPAPPPLDDDEDVQDAEIVEPAALVPGPSISLPAADYTEAGVPSLDYLRDRIEGRYATAIGSTELARAAATRAGGSPERPRMDIMGDGRYAGTEGSTSSAEDPAMVAREKVAKAAAEQQAAVTAEQQQAARDAAAKAKLDEIRRSLHPE